MSDGRYERPARNRSDRVPEGCPLANREYDVVCLLAEGLSQKEVAHRLGIARSTVSTTLGHARSRFGLGPCRTLALVVILKDSGWLGAPPRPPRQGREPDDGCTPPQLAYAYAFVRLCRERTPRAVLIVTVAYMLLCADRGWTPSRPRRNPDIDALLLRMARGLSRPVYAGLGELAEAA